MSVFGFPHLDNAREAIVMVALGFHIGIGGDEAHGTLGTIWVRIGACVCQTLNAVHIRLTGGDEGVVRTPTQAR